jgi:aminopeptidase N
MTTARHTFTVPGCAPITVNADARGYYVTAYEQSDAVRLAAAAPTKLSPAERLTLLHDQWALVRAGRRGADDFLALAEHFRGERDGAVVTRLATAFEGMTYFISDQRSLRSYREWVRDFLRPIAAELGWSDASTPGCGCGAVRPIVLYALGFTGRDAETLDRSVSMAGAWLDDRAKVDPPLVRNVLALAAATGNDALYGRMRERLAKENAPDDAALLMRTITRFRAPSQIDETLEWILSPSVKPQDAVRMLGGLLAERESQAHAWELIKAQWPRVKEKIAPGSAASAGAMVAATRSFCDPALRDDVRRFFTTHPVEGAEQRLAESLEVMGQCTAVVAAQQPRVASWLEKQAKAASAAAN